MGEATFIRFCRTLGFRGFTDFKLELAIELATREKQYHSLLDTDISPSDDPKNIAAKLQGAVTNVIAETINLLDFNELEKVVNTMMKAKRIFLFGVGSSGITAEDEKINSCASVYKWIPPQITTLCICKLHSCKKVML